MKYDGESEREIERDGCVQSTEKQTNNQRENLFSTYQVSKLSHFKPSVLPKFTILFFSKSPTRPLCLSPTQQKTLIFEFELIRITATTHNPLFSSKNSHYPPSHFHFRAQTHHRTLLSLCRCSSPWVVAASLLLPCVDSASLLLAVVASLLHVESIVSASTLSGLRSQVSSSLFQAFNPLRFSNGNEVIIGRRS
ncbi:hypothetical protein HN51_023626 [Arachis hypogaea]